MKISEILPANHGGKFWTHSIELVTGCTKVSPGCENCWSEAMDKRFKRKGFDGTLSFNWDKLDAIIPGNHRRKPRVWTYWNDVFHQDVSERFQTAAFNAAGQAPNDYHIICTKRPEILLDYLQDRREKNRVNGWWTPFKPHESHNLMFLITMEDCQWAHKRNIYARKLASDGWNVGILAEPLLSEVNLGLTWWEVLPKWIITGAETGPHARPCDPDWLRSLRDQAQKNGIPFWLKHVNKKYGRTLDGREWSETP